MKITRDSKQSPFCGNAAAPVMRGKGRAERRKLSGTKEKKKMLICANVHSTEEYFPVCCLFKSDAELAEAIVHPCCEGITDIIRFVVHGDSYKERKACVRDLAIAFQGMDQGGLSWGEVALVDDWFRKNGKRYGLMDEFVENAIC